MLQFHLKTGSDFSLLLQTHGPLCREIQALTCYKNLIEKRQLSHDHPDQQYAVCVFRYLRQAAIKLRHVGTLIFVDDKHHIKIGEPGYPVAAVERGKMVIVGKDVSFCVGDHDFTKFKMIPSVTCFARFLKRLESFYDGQIMVTLKEGAFEASSPLHHAAEMKADLKLLSINTAIRPVLLLYSNGGPDHNITFGNVKVALIALFRSLQLDYLLAARACPGHSFRNPVERCMSILNRTLQSVALMRASTSAAVDKYLSSVSTTSDIRKLAEKEVEVQSAVKQSIDPVKTTLEEVLTRVELHNTPVKVSPSASDSQIAELWEEMLSVDPNLHIDEIMQANMNEEMVSAFLPIVADHKVLS